MAKASYFKCWRQGALFFMALSIAISSTAFEKAPLGARSDPTKIKRDDVEYSQDPSQQGINHGVLYYPLVESDTRDENRWKIFVASFIQDPPSSVIVNVYNDSPALSKTLHADVMVEVGYFDEGNNFMLELKKTVKNIPMKSGFNRVPVYIHNDKGEVIRIRLLAVRPKGPILQISVTPD